MSDGRSFELQTVTNKICTPVCLSRDPLQMILRFAKSMVQRLMSAPGRKLGSTGRNFFRLYLRPRSRAGKYSPGTRPPLFHDEVGDNYVFEVEWGDWEWEASQPLRISLDKNVLGMGNDVDLVRITNYAPGDPIGLDNIPPQLLSRKRLMAEKVLTKAHGRLCDLVVYYMGLPHRVKIGDLDLVRKWGDNDSRNVESGILLVYGGVAPENG